MSDLDTDPGEILTDFPAQSVEYTTDITDGDSWAFVPFLWCQSLKLAVNAYDTAKLRYEVGLGVMQPGDSIYRDWQPLSLRGKYVRVTIGQESPLEPITWVGYIVNDDLSRDGVVDDAGTNKFQGECQLLDAVGLEWFLDRRQIDSSVVYPDVRIGRVLKFNGGESQSIDMKAAHRGNRSHEPNGADFYVFTDDPTTDHEFDASDIARYLLKYQTPEDSDGEPSPCEFALDDDSGSILENWRPTAVSENGTTFQLLNKLISPQRGLCWWLQFDQDLAKAFVHVATMGTDDIALPGGGTFPANDSPTALNFDDEVDVKTCQLTNLGSRQYHRFIARGARQTVTFTAGIADDTLEIDWKSETEDAYLAGASADADYSSLSSDRKRGDRNDALRVGDLLKRVYAFFKLPSDWNGKSGDGNTATKDWAIAEIEAGTGSIVGGLPLTVPGLRLLNRTRLKLGVDYSDPNNPASNAPDGSLEEFVPPFALLQVETTPALDSNPTPERWQHCNQMQQHSFHAGTKISSHIKTSYHLIMQEHAPGVVLRAAGAPQHTMALNYFDTGGGAEPSRVKPEVDYTSLRVTICAESDNYAEGVSEVDPLPSGVPIQELVVDLGDDYRLDFLAKNTIVDLQSGIPVLAASAALLRDDRTVLRDIATIGGQWYSVERNKLTVEFRQLRNLFSLGQLITTIGTGSTQSTVNTVVSTISYNFDKSGTMTIETNDATLDLRGIV